MKKFNNKIGPYKILAIIVSILILFFSAFVFFNQVSDKSDLESAVITELLELEDNQGLIYQNLLVRLEKKDTTINTKIPINLPEVRALEKGDVIYLQKVGGSEELYEYRYASSDKTIEFGLLVVGFVLVIVSVLGFKPIQSLYPSVTFLILLIAGVFSLSTEVRFVFLSILGFMVIFTFITVLWYFEDIFLGIISSILVGLSLIFSVLLHSILINFSRSTEPINIVDLFSTNSVVNDFEQSKLMVVMIIVYSLLVQLFSKLIKDVSQYCSSLKKVNREKLLKFAVSVIKLEIAHLLNLVFFLALALNFLGLISEDYSVYRYIWNNSFFISVVVDGIVTGTTLIVAGYMMAFIIGLYFSKSSVVDK